ncbi:hypothetical protein GYMLUDRAFT_64608 [Collybiopsis luxurians FD-317 M1]|uniref:Uncharacterized protein n=1 Tax=Collybiopsis luxurians FD-317 M1 TaxID=944289 RepID=A0A0D0CAC2_9AGAR|nr:hypothetical protein GYMLUDRAFT_64608 [Collybiopsis luxurians FD-317 M1]
MTFADLLSEYNAFIQETYWSTLSEVKWEDSVDGQGNDVPAAPIAKATVSVCSSRRQERLRNLEHMFGIVELEELRVASELSALYSTIGSLEKGKMQKDWWRSEIVAAAKLKKITEQHRKQLVHEYQEQTCQPEVEGKCDDDTIVYSFEAWTDKEKKLPLEQQDDIPLVKHRDGNILVAVKDVELWHKVMDGSHSHLPRRQGKKDKGKGRVESASTTADNSESSQVNQGNASVLKSTENNRTTSTMTPMALEVGITTSPALTGPPPPVSSSLLYNEPVALVAPQSHMSAGALSIDTTKTGHRACETTVASARLGGTMNQDHAVAGDEEFMDDGLTELLKDIVGQDGRWSRHSSNLRASKMSISKYICK